MGSAAPSRPPRSPEERVRIICTDSGGGFGIKGHTYAEDVILAAAARRLGVRSGGRSRGGSTSSAARRIAASVTGRAWA
jgi:CO/xanthine dehydrogenase Mo-binding subunit